MQHNGTHWTDAICGLQLMNLTVASCFAQELSSKNHYHYWFTMRFASSFPLIETMHPVNCLFISLITSSKYTLHANERFNNWLTTTRSFVISTITFTYGYWKCSHVFFVFCLRCNSFRIGGVYWALASNRRWRYRMHANANSTQINLISHTELIWASING